jgi:hypothetical protein
MAEPGLNYLRARYYHPAAAQFIFRDLLGDDYVAVRRGGSLLNVTDPIGLCAIDSARCPDRVGDRNLSVHNSAHVTVFRELTLT